MPSVRVKLRVPGSFETTPEASSPLPPTLETLSLPFLKRSAKQQQSQAKPAGPVSWPADGATKVSELEVWDCETFRRGLVPHAGWTDAPYV